MADVDLAARPALTMSCSRREAEAVITGLEKPINDQLLTLLVAGDPADAGHWREELLEWLDEVAEIRLRPANRTAPAAFYFRILFDEPFGGTGVDNIARRVARLARRGYVIRSDVDFVATRRRLGAFHEAFAFARGKSLSADDIHALIDQMSA